MNNDDPGYTSKEYTALQDVVDAINELKNEAFLEVSSCVEFQNANKNIFDNWADAAFHFAAHARDVYAFSEGRVQDFSTETEISRANDRQLSNEPLTKILAANYLVARKAMTENFRKNKKFGFMADDIDLALDRLSRNLLNFGREEIKELAQSFQPPTLPLP